MYKRHPIFWLWLAGYLLVACGSPIAASNSGQGTTAHEASTLSALTPLPQFPPEECPITRPPEKAFVPPEPYAPEAPYGQFWYGTDALWTALAPDGSWIGLPHNDRGYVQKVFWWREGFDMTVEPRPQITVSGRRLDSDASSFEQTGGTNGYHGDMGQFMLTGVQVPTEGCWEITGRYGTAELSFVVWVKPGKPLDG